MKPRSSIVFLFLSSLAFIQCGKEKTAFAVLPVFVSIAPQKYIVDKIGGPLVAVSVMVGPGASPHSYEPRPSQMTALSNARAYFSIGLEFESAWLPKFSNLHRGMVIVPMDSGVAKRPIDFFKEKPAKGMDGSWRHAQHSGLDPHIWLSPQLVRKQAKTVCDALCKLDPVHDSAYRANDDAFASEITTVQKSIRAILYSDDPSKKRKSFMVFHPSWAYFAGEFGLRQLAIEIEGREPSAKQLQMIIDTARYNGIRTIFVQPQFSQRSAQIIARQLNIRVAIANDLAYDWGDNLIAFAKALALQ